MNLRDPLAGLQNARSDSQEGRFTGPVVSDHTERSTTSYLEAHVVKRDDSMISIPSPYYPANEPLLEGRNPPLRRNSEVMGHSPEIND